MPTGIEQALNRRRWLQGMGLLAAMPLATSHAARPSGPARSLAAAWMQGDQMRVGIVQASAQVDRPLQVLQALDVPTRAHGMAALRDGSVVFASRRQC